MNKKVWFLTTLFLALFFANRLSFAEEKEIILTTHNLKPYTYFDEQKNFVGTSVKTVSCVLDKIDRPYRYVVVPWKRAQEMVVTGKADAFFAASQNETRDQYAVLSTFIEKQVWTWFFLKKTEIKPDDAGFKENAVVGSFLGANMLSWLKKNDYRIFGSIAPETENLAKQLLAGRMDAILANPVVFKDILKRIGGEERVSSLPFRNKPLGVYFSKRFLSNNSGFMKEFNSFVPICRGNRTN